MIEKLHNILEKTKLCYKESVLLENEVLEESLLTIMSNTKYLIDNYEDVKPQKRKSTMSKVITDEYEIEKIHRKIPQWLERPHQINHQILVTFMKLSNCNENPIPLSTLEKNCNIDSKKFNSNFDQMKIISEKNNGKVFEEENGNVSLWNPISQFVTTEYKKRFS